jgi:hypothetical protein
MDSDPRGFPPGEMRVSDADRDRALSELGEAFRVGRITADEFDERSGQVLSTRTGKELTSLLADLPVERVPSGTVASRRAGRAPASRVFVGASVGAACFTLVALNALRPGPTLAQRELMRSIMARQGISIPLPPSQGFNWAGTLIPGAIAVVLVVLMISLRVIRAHRA